MSKNVKKFGLIGGLISFVSYFGFYFIDKSLLGSMWIGFLFMIITIILMVMAAKRDRTDQGGVLSFGDAFKSAFFTSLVATVVGSIGSILLFNVVDTGLNSEVNEMIMQNTEELMQSMGAPSSAIDETIDGMIETPPADFSVMGILKSILGVAVFYAIVAAIIGAVVKKEESI